MCSRPLNAVVYFRCFDPKIWWKQRLKLAGFFILPLLLINGSFFIWDPGAFWDDIIAFNAGHTQYNYLIGGTPGYGAANFLLTWQKVSSRTDYYPFWIWMIITVLPMMLFMLVKLYRSKTTNLLLIGYALTMFTTFYFSRLFHDNYIGFIVALLIAGYFATDKKDNEVSEFQPTQNE